MFSNIRLSMEQAAQDLPFLLDICLLRSYWAVIHTGFCSVSATYLTERLLLGEASVTDDEKMSTPY